MDDRDCGERASGTSVLMVQQDDDTLDYRDTDTTLWVYMAKT